MKRRTLIHLALLVALTLGCYAHTLSYPFHFDDGMFIVDNPLVTKAGALMNPDSIITDPALSESVTGSRFTRWIGYASLRLNYIWGGLDTRGYHVINIAVHLACGLLVYALVLLCFSSPALHGRASDDDAALITLIVAALFIAHPIQTQAVTYITQRFASMAAMFCLSAMVAYLRWRLGGRVLWLAIAVASAAAAMFTKENSFVLPVAIALCEFALFQSRHGAKRPYWALALMASTMMIVPLAVLYSSSGGAADATAIHKEISRSAYLMTQFAVIITYLRMLVLPYGLSLDHDYPLYTSLADPVVAGSALALALISIVALRGYLRAARDGGPGAMIYTGVLLVFVFLSVESSVVVLANLIFEHRMYLPMAGVAMALAGALGLIMQRGVPRRTVMAIVLVAIIALAVSAHERNKVWASEAALWSDAAFKAPMKPRPHASLAKALADAGNYAEAEPQYRRALKLDPGYDVDVRPEAMYNLAILLRQTGREAEAEAAYTEMLRLYPGARAPIRAMAHYNLGNLYLKQSRLDEAATEWQRAVDVLPMHSKALNQLGNYHAMRGESDLAVTMYRRAIDADPSNAEARANLKRLSAESPGK